MVLDDLLSKIELLKSRIQTHRQSLEVYETRTRVVLIDPLLQSLGWDVSDPARIIVEHPVELGGVVDYALIDNSNQVVAILEAKKLGSPLTNNNQMQLLNYAVASGIRFAGLTNGDCWEVYDVFKQVKLEEKRILDISISKTPTHQIALKFLLLLHPNLSSGNPVLATTPISIVEENRVVPKPQPQHNWVQLSEYSPSLGTKPPSAIRFWDNSQLPVKYWNEILLRVVEKLIQEKRINDKDIPVQFGTKTYVINSQPVHPRGNKFVAYETMGDKPFYVNKHYSAKETRTNIIKLLERFDYTPSKVYLKVD